MVSCKLVSALIHQERYRRRVFDGVKKTLNGNGFPFRHLCLELDTVRGKKSGIPFTMNLFWMLVSLS